MNDEAFMPVDPGDSTCRDTTRLFLDSIVERQWMLSAALTIPECRDRTLLYGKKTDMADRFRASL